MVTSSPLLTNRLCFNRAHPRGGGGGGVMGAIISVARRGPIAPIMLFRSFVGT